MTPLPVAPRTTACARCETLPRRPEGAGRLHLWCPSPHGVAKAAAVARRRALAAAPLPDGGIAIGVGDDALGPLVGDIGEALSALEAADARALFVAGDAPLGADHVGRVTSFARLHALLDAGWLVALLEERRLTSLFQPIALGDDPTRIVGHEALLRGVGADGAMVPPGQLFDGARRAGLLFQLDLAARRTHIASAARVGLGGLLFINFAPTAIYDPASCLRSTVAAIDAAGIAHERVVFEIVETEATSDTAHLRRILDYYRGVGFRVALDDVGAGYSSLNRLHLLRPDLLKLDMELVRGVHADPYKAVVAGKVLDLAHTLGIPVVAEGIETDEELAWVRERGAAYVQGWRIGRPAAEPRPVRAGDGAGLAAWHAPELAMAVG